ncbi:alpha/beta fold hydrolase [Thermostaphylospora chromogena]|uniref:Pimeloyl-ACP methyl ester carboxylesterase n=1 Tax=Thermostaphylospora chromogena TaxID=35622 RepID=A0A1H1AY08_9ACTN|nr:alpha/beta hydrolase [Thermostaphylospora chromogena]SDQ44523.1 Pimeloyl-ACP methyl ester carboxylesterase [Thermostaphylospora chromogena]
MRDRSDEEGDTVDEPIPHWPGELLDLDDRKIHVRSSPDPGGDADRAIFVHGLAGSATNWTDLMDRLKDVVAGHAIDLPGAGLSPAAPDGDYSVAAHARTVAAAIERLSSKPVHLFGNSLGGAVSVRVAATRPDLVRSLTLISPALPDLLPRYGPARVALSALPGVGEWAMTRLTAIPPERRLTATLAMCYADTARVHPERFRDAVEELRRRDELPHAASALVCTARGIVAEYFRRGRDNLWRLASRVKAPTLVIHGRHDRLVDPRMAARAARTFPRVRLVLLPMAGHVAQMEYPDVVAREARLLIAEAVREAVVSPSTLGNARAAG